MDVIREDQTPNEPAKEPIQVDPQINFFGMTNFRNQNRKFGIKLDDRRRHTYVVGKTGMGKTTMLENMVLNDIYAGNGVGVVDPHGDFAEKIIDYIPANRINDVVYFNPSDMDYPIGFNILETVNPAYKHLVASGLMGVFKKIWPDVWSARMEYILNNTILALIEFPNTTLLGINRLLADAAYRRRVVRNLKDPVVRSFWETEFANYSDKYRQEAVAPVQNKIGQFLSASVIRNIVAQVKSKIDIREIMDTRKIFIVNLSKGRIGEDNSRLLGGMIITKIQLAAMERVDMPENERKDFFLYVDEFQNFANESFANILSEARKYRLDLTMAHQYMEQLDETVLAAIIGNVGTIITFRVGSTDAEILAKEFAPVFLEEDLVNLPKFQTYLKLMIDGVASSPFSAVTLPPIGTVTGSAEKVIKVSRERYATNRDKIEDKIIRWSGMETSDSGDMEDEESETTFEDEKKQPAVVENIPAAPEAEIIPQEKPEPKLEPKIQPQPYPQKQEMKREPRQDFKPQGQNQNSNNKNRRDKKNKSKGDLNVKESKPVLLVDPEQKGISLSKAMQPKQPPASAHPQNREQPRQPKPQMPPQVQPKTEPQPKPAPQPAPPVQEAPKQNNNSEQEKKLYPDRVMKIGDDQP